MKRMAATALILASAGFAGLAHSTPVTTCEVAGAELGCSQALPILPFVSASGVFEFAEPVSGRWYDPPFAIGFEFELFGAATFSSITMPDGFFDLSLIANATLLTSDLDAGETFDFGPGVTKFRITGFSPAVDAGNPGVFPIFLNWDGIATTLTMTPIPEDDSRVPEPGTLGLICAACLGLLAARRRAAYC